LIELYIVTLKVSIEPLVGYPPSLTYTNFFVSSVVVKSALSILCVHCMPIHWNQVALCHFQHAEVVNTPRLVQLPGQTCSCAM